MIGGFIPLILSAQSPEPSICIIIAGLAVFLTGFGWGCIKVSKACGHIVFYDR